jgi:hypothetical protein
MLKEETQAGAGKVEEGCLGKERSREVQLRGEAGSKAQKKAGKEKGQAGTAQKHAAGDRWKGRKRKKIRKKNSTYEAVTQATRV